MKIQQELFHRTQTTEDFLFYKTDEKPLEESTQVLPEAAGNVILEKFPDLLSGASFVEAVQTAVDNTPQFGVMAIGLDDILENGDRSLDDTILQVLECLNSVCESEKGIWGKLESDLFAAVFPGKDAAHIQSIAEALQDGLADHTPQTITIGMAAYPVLDYDKGDMVQCTLKALNHAAFFGPNSRAFFDAVSLNISGDQCYQKGDIHGAISEYQQALKIDPDDVNVLNSMGVCYAVMGDVDTALSYFESAGKIDPNEVMAWYNSALIYKLKGDKQKALDHFLKAGTKKADSFEIAFQTGKIYFETGDEGSGRKYYQKALTLTDGTDGNQRFVGDCHMALNETDLALKAYGAAIKENPNDAYALSALGMLYDQKGENPEIAMVFCQQSVDIAPQNSLFRRRLALLYLKQKEWDKALEEFKKADQLDEASIGFENKEKKKLTKKPSNKTSPEDERSVA